MIASSSRDVVRMATGAALYGVFSWLTNVLLLPSASLISLRPGVVIPIFFGLSWGPRVGFFSGFVGNLIGDALSGMGFFPPWDLGNGVMGAVAGLAPLAGRSRRAVDGLVAACAALLGGLGWWMAGDDALRPAPFGGPDFAPSAHAGWPLAVAVALVALRLATRGRSPAVAATVWGVLAVVCGMGTAALLDVPYNGMAVSVALFGEFLPAVVSNTVNALVLLPPLLRAHERALDRRGR